MKNILRTVVVGCLLSITIMGTPALAQIDPKEKIYEPSAEFPFGWLNPTTDPAVGDFDPIIGTCICESIQRNSDGTWQDTLQMEWKFKYIMNGTAVQDEVWRDGGLYAGSIRQYHVDSAKWVVTYFSYPFVSATPGVWLGSKDEEGKIVLYQDQKAPNGLDGKSRLTFSRISKEGFHWKGEWVDLANTITYPFWHIYCRKRKKSIAP